MQTLSLASRGNEEVMRLGLGAGPSSHQLPRGPGPESAQCSAKKKQGKPGLAVSSPAEEGSKVPSLTLADTLLDTGSHGQAVQGLFALMEL